MNRLDELYFMIRARVIAAAAYIWETVQDLFGVK